MVLQTPQHSDRNLALELVRVTEAAAIAAAQLDAAGAIRTRPTAPPSRRCAAPSTLSPSTARS